MKTTHPLKLLFILILLFPFCTIEAQEYEIKRVTVEVELAEFEVTNEAFLSVLDSLILSHNYNTGYRKNYVYVTFIERKCIKSIITIILIRPTFISDLSNLGFFRRQGALFIIRGDNSSNLFLETERKEIISYEMNVIEINGEDIDYDNFMPEEFSSWTFSYINGEFTLLGRDME